MSLADSAPGLSAATSRPWRLVRTYLAGEATAMSVAMLLATLSTVFALLQPMVVQSMLDAAANGQPLGTYMLLLGGIAAAGASAAGGQILVLGRLGARVVRGTRKRLVARMLTLPMRIHQRFSPGEFASRLTSDPTLIQSAVSEGLVTAVSSSLTLVGATIALLWLDAPTFALAFGATVLSVLLTVFVGPHVKRLRIAGQGVLGAMGAEIQRAAVAMPVLRAYNATQHASKSVDRHVDAAYANSAALARLFAVIQPISMMLMQVALGCTILVGGLRVASGQIDFSTLLTFLLYFSLVVQPLGSLSQTFLMFQEAAAGHDRVTQVTSIPSETDADHVGPSGDSEFLVAASSQTPLEVRFERVSFGYSHAERCLCDVSFVAPAGRRTAIVGPTGAGKSTLFALLERFHEPSEGSIRIGASDLRTVSRRNVRSVLGYVDQGSVGLSGTLRDNLSLGGLVGSEQEIRAVLTGLSLGELVKKLDDDLDGQVGENAVRLSGGERQRVSLARALLAHPRVLLLDEPTASLDGLTEASLMAFLGESLRDTTTIMIAHRLGTVVNADHIVVLDRGEVVDSGTHEQLLKRSQYYVDLIRTQLIT